MNLIVIAILINFDVLYSKPVKYHINQFYPVILIPGDGGSRAYKLNIDTKEMELLWFSFNHMLFPNQLIKDFRLKKYESTNTRVKSKTNEKIVFPGWGSTDTIENLSDWPFSKTEYFRGLVQGLLLNPYYTKNWTLRGAPYDFRKAPYTNKKFLNRFPRLVEETFRNSNNTRVVVVAHSLGCLYALHTFRSMDESWKRLYVQAFVATGAPVGGSIKALMLELSGISFGIPRNSMLFREVERSFSSTAYLLPQPGIFPQSHILVVTPKKNYTAFDYRRLFTDIGFFDAYEMLYRPLRFHDADEALSGIADVHCVHGTNVKTPVTLFYSNQFPDESPAMTYGDGDGTVNINSLSLCRNWHGSHYHTLPGAQHKAILADPRYVNLVIKVASVRPF